MVVDHKSKWLAAAPIRDKSASSVANALKSCIIPNLLRIPTNVLTDNGLEFKGKETEDILANYGINHIYSSPYNPASNGAVERVNRTLINTIKALTNDLRVWNKILPKAIVVYNNTIHSKLHASPSEFLLKNEFGPCLLYTSDAADE